MAKKWIFRDQFQWLSKAKQANYPLKTMAAKRGFL
jgi:hypothetical protein